MSTPRRGSFRASRHDRGRRKTQRDPRCDRAETLAEPGIPATAAGTLLRHHRNPLPQGWRRGGRRCSCSSSAARAETLSDRQEDLRRPPKKTPVVTLKKILRNSEQFPRTPKDPPSPEKNRRTHRKNPPKLQKIAKNHENMAKRAKNVLLAISSGGGGIFIFL